MNLALQVNRNLATIYNLNLFLKIVNLRCILLHIGKTKEKKPTNIHSTKPTIGNSFLFSSMTLQ